MASGVEFPQPATKQAFLAALEATGKVFGTGGACDTLGVSVPIVYKWRSIDPEFAAAWTIAQRAHLETRAEKAWTVVDEILADKEHKDRLAAAKVAIDRGETVTARQAGGDDDGIAEAIDRFTSLVAGLAQSARGIQDPSPLRAAIAAGNTHPETES